MPLDLGSLILSVEALERVLSKSQDEGFMVPLDSVGRDLVTSGVIQHFEFTYELCWKFMKRWVETNVSPAMADGVTRRELFRLAAESRLIHDVEQWMRYHEARNLTAHTYQPLTAQRVYQMVPPFARDARLLLDALIERND